MGEDVRGSAAYHGRDGSVTTMRQEHGRRAELLACEFLQGHGLELLVRNYRRRLGELDLVLRDGATLVIVEVRTRSRAEFGGAAESIDGLKRRRIVRAAQQLLQRRGELARMPSRFDVVVVHDIASDKPRLEWIRHAFSAEG
jgi:putative endonuclease